MTLLRLLAVGAAAVLLGVSTPPSRAQKTPASTLAGAPADTVALSDAVALALGTSPDLVALGFEATAREALVRQAGRRPNPTLGLDAENLLAPSGNGMGGGETAQTTLAAALPLELGGRRAARVRLAEAELDLLAPEVDAARRNTRARAVARFAAALAAQGRAQLAAETAALAEEVRSTVAQQVALGDRSPIDETRAGVALARARAEQARAVRTLEAALRSLAALWGEPDRPPTAVAGALATPVVPSFEGLADRLDATPELARVAAEAVRRDAAVEVARTDQSYFPTVSAGVRRYHGDEGGFGAVVGVSLPIPVFSRGSDALAAAEARRGGLDAERLSARNALVADLADAYGRLAAARDEAAILAQTALPGALDAAAAVAEGYRLGAFSVLDVLDAQRSVAEVRGLLLDALAEAAAAQADVERVLGGSLPTAPADVPRLPTPDSTAPTPDR
ncbi:MAG TPA: TolC family protein [Rubricoccaceae bacterium]|jgi:cobalt-zinc-cadmium efflux system outer membrane protein